MAHIYPARAARGKHSLRLRDKAEDTEDETVKTPKDIELLNRVTELLERQNELLEMQNKGA